MKKILLISDSHGQLEEDVLEYVHDRDEVWHAGDIGFDDLSDQCPPDMKLRAVHGNIDGHIIRSEFPEYLFFEVEELKVLMIHIGGYPARYNGRARQLLTEFDVDLMITGHSHILKIMRDNKLDHIHMNPGACGHKGFHSVRTSIRFNIQFGQITDVEVIELGPRGRLDIS